MLRVTVEAELLGLAGRRADQRTLQLTADLSNHVRVAVDDHIFVFSVGNTGIFDALLLQVSRLEFNVMVVIVDTENTFEQRFGAVPLDVYPCPSHRPPQTIVSPQQGSPFEDLVFMSLDRFLAMNVSFRVKVLHVCIIGKDIMVGF